MSGQLNFEEKAGEEKIVEIPREERYLRTQAYDKGISDIITMIKANDIIINPEYQRNYIWNNKKASLFVESVLLNVPLPSIYVSEEDDGKWSVIDGLQRLNSLRRFFNNEFKLTGLEVLNELNGLTYYKLNPKALRILGNGILRIILIFKESNPSIKYDIFMRLNRGSVTLSEQELRNCLHRGPFNDLLKELVQNQQFLDILRLKKPHKRMRDVELILRYFAISDEFKKNQVKLRNYKGSMKEFLNEYMKNQKSISQEKIKNFSTRFEITIDKVYSVFGDRAFRRIDTEGNFDGTLNRAVADFIMSSFEKIDKTVLVSKKEKVCNLLKELPNKDEKFYESISIGTSDTLRLEYRLVHWQKAINHIF